MTSPSVDDPDKYDNLRVLNGEQIQDEDDKFLPKFPLQNITSEQYQRIAYISPSADTFLNQTEFNVASHIADVRSRERLHPYAFSLATVATGVMYRMKHKYTMAMFVPLSLIGTSWMYHWSLGYGQMLNRISIETQSILRERQYYLTDEDVLDIEKQIREAENQEPL